MIWKKKRKKEQILNFACQFNVFENIYFDYIFLLGCGINSKLFSRDNNEYTEFSTTKYRT